MVSTDHFRQELLAQMGRAAHGGLDIRYDQRVRMNCTDRSVAIPALSTGCHRAAMLCRLK